MMRWKMVNRTPHLLIVSLNSGKTVHLAPNETSSVLEHAEINGNAKLDKLLADNSITLVQEKMQTAAPVARPEARRNEPEPVKEPEPVEEEHASKREQEPEREPPREAERERESKREHKKK